MIQLRNDSLFGSVFASGRRVCQLAALAVFANGMANFATPAAAAEPLAAGKLLGLPYSDAMCGLRKDMDRNEIYVGVKFSVINLSNLVEVKETDTLKAIFRGLREKFIGSSDGIFTVFAKVADQNNETLALFPVYHWDDKTKRDQVDNINRFFVINHRLAESLPQLNLSFDIRYKEDVNSNVFVNVKKVLELATTAYSGGIGSATIALGASKLKDASEYDRQLKLFLDRDEEYKYRPVPFQPLDFLKKNCPHDKGEIQPYTALGTNKPKRGLSLVISGQVKETDQPVIATLELVYRSSLMLDRDNQSFSELPLVQGNNHQEMVSAFKTSVVPTLSLKDSIERSIIAVDPQNDPNRSQPIKIEKLVLGDREISLRSKFARVGTTVEEDLIGSACADLLGVVSSSPLTKWEKALFTAGYLERAGQLNAEVLNKCMLHAVELQSIPRRIIQLGLVAADTNPGATSGIIAYLRAAKVRAEQPGANAFLAVSDAYSLSTRNLEQVVKLNTSFSSFYVPSSFSVEAFKKDILQDSLKPLIGSYLKQWELSLKAADHPLYKAKGEDKEYWTLEKSINRLINFEGVHNPLLATLFMQHLATTKSLNFKCVEKKADLPAKDGKFWTLEGFSTPGKNKILTLDLKNVGKDVLKSGSCYFAAA